MRKTILLGSVFVAFVAIALCTSMAPAVHAGVAASFTPPPTLTVTMWKLYDWGEKTDTPCSQDINVRLTWGCTAYCNNSTMCPLTRFVAYPFSSENATVDIEGMSCAPNGNYDCYLRDVAPLEIDIKTSSRDNKALSSVQAQASAARTYAYYYRNDMNNSNARQVFVPYYYDSLSLDQQTRVADVVASIYYLSYYDSDAPIAALYGSDNGAQTSQAGYLAQAVAPGATLAVTLPIQPSAGSLSLDLYYQPPWGTVAWFAAGVQSDWPWLRQPLDQLLLQCPRLPLMKQHEPVN